MVSTSRVRGEEQPATSQNDHWPSTTYGPGLSSRFLLNKAILMDHPCRIWLRSRFSTRRSPITLYHTRRDKPQVLAEPSEHGFPNHLSLIYNITSGKVFKVAPFHRKSAAILNTEKFERITVERKSTQNSCTPLEKF